MEKSPSVFLFMTIDSYKKLDDLVITFEGDQVFVRSNSNGVGIVTDPEIVGVLSFFNQPRTTKDFIDEYGEDGLSVLEDLVDAGMLVPEGHQGDTSVFFGFFSGMDVHRNMLADQERLSKYREAIFEVVKPGDVVIDAGAGTGILSIYAAQAGAKKVYAIDNSEMAYVIPRLAAENGFQDVIQVVQEDFSRVALSEKADVMVSETFGFWVLDEGALPDLRSCAQNNLKEDGIMIPQSFSLYLAPVLKDLDNLIKPFRDRFDGVMMECLALEAEMQSSVNSLTAQDIGKEALVGRYPLLEASEWFESSISLQGPASALCAYFVLHLTDKTDLGNRPGGKVTSWKQASIPVSLPNDNNELKLEFGPAPENKRTIELRIDGSISKTLRIS